MSSQPLTRPSRAGKGRRPPLGLLVAALAAGVAFDAVNLLLRSMLGVPSLPEAMSDLLVPFIPASLFGQLLAKLGPYGKQIVFVSSLLGLALGIATAVVVYRRVCTRLGVARATAALAVIGWALLAAIFWSVLGANDAGGQLFERHLLGLLDLGLATTAAAMVALVLVGLPATRGAQAEAATALDRRRFLGSLGAAIAVLAVGGTGIVAGVRHLMKLSNLGYEGYGTPASALGPITPTRNFYVVSKNLIDPIVDADRWRLVIDGMVEHELALTLADLQRLPQVDSVATLECIANGVGGSLMSTAKWQGPRLTDVIAAAGPRGNPSHAELSAIDGYYDTVRVDELGIEGAVLALRMNGEVLTDRHGYPARIVLPGRYGEKQMKWLTGIHLTTTPSTGFYQRQGWSEMGTIRTWSRFDNLKENMKLSAGMEHIVTGHAFAGTRGIEGVEVSVDGGVTWTPAELEEFLGRNAWRYFRWTWRTPVAGNYVLAVRARDGEGMAQETRYEDIVPKGSSGLHRVKVDVV
ncbi:MAG: hypothetical protein NVSMB17_02650 [Candidatus Dormibacteria bacterium]